MQANTQISIHDTKTVTYPLQKHSSTLFAFVGSTIHVPRVRAMTGEKVFVASINSMNKCKDADSMIMLDRFISFAIRMIR